MDNTQAHPNYSFVILLILTKSNIPNEFSSQPILIANSCGYCVLYINDQ